ncbi:aa3-type cytochrome c oxidase subunit IV [Paracoccus sp. S-4012]|uniref:aa3-type cytochrome c oxidase subunit IV n=1 Tax=Paracoccus sp. S-4012 TaxID=2665648 RepID=UPI0012B0E000|nr:aa3-type cytochrome c oxidase subunit IV [Paracoccus sp. S-4012]MRX49776.1 aa3-type cytochrome c oxidase subunit IV [Paracoccus sp. S-4012]
MATTTTTTTTTTRRDAPAGGHVHGTMDATRQDKTFHGFIKVLTWSAVISILTLIFLALVNA